MGSTLMRICSVSAVAFALTFGCTPERTGRGQELAYRPEAASRSTATPSTQPQGRFIAIQLPFFYTPPVTWAANELAEAIRARGYESAVYVPEGIPDPDHPETIKARSREGAWTLAGDFHVVFAESEYQPGARAQLGGQEAYELVPVRGGLQGCYSDTVGGMYALLDLAERVRLKGIDALRLAEKEEHRPTIAFRAVNPFLSIPLADKDGIRDWEHWWFTDEEYWRGYLDLLAKAQINWIDMHGMYDIQVTSFPNIWPYFVASEKYPDVGVPPEQARKNLAMLEKICVMAKERGIKLAIMNYTGGWNWPGCRPAPERPVADFIEYTKEGLKQIVQGCPDLAMIGFRIGESGYGEDFYAKSYVAALEELGRPLPLYTRTWGAEKKKLMELGQMYPDKFVIEIKYNGEQMGPPWHVAGGRMAGWRDYSYQDYLFYPRAYKVVWQIRANGTHRIFQWASFEHIRECVKTTNLADSIGFCVEPMSTYYPVTDFFHKEPLFRWEYERNPLWYLMWGRLAYDPQTPEEVFRLAAREHWGEEYGDKAYALLQSMSRVVPAAKTQYSLGPDHRNHAPELEWGGSIRQWARGQPFDTYFAEGPGDFARELLAGMPSGRRTPLQTAAILAKYANETDKLSAGLPDGISKALDDLKLDARLLAALGRYYAARLEAATALALAEMSGSPERAPSGGTDEAEGNSPVKLSDTRSQKRWSELADLGDQYYHPFIDTLRMHTQTYLWSQATRNFSRDGGDLGTVFVSDVPMKQPVRSAVGDGSKLALRVWPDDVDTHKDKQALTVHATVGGLESGETFRNVNLLWKPFRSESSWRRIPMQRAGGQPGAGQPEGETGGGKTEWTATVLIDSQGALYGLEVVTDKNATMARVDGPRPYGVIDPWPVK